MTSKLGRGGKKPQPERSPQPRSKQSGAFQTEIADESSEEEVERSEQLQRQRQQLSPSQTSGSSTQTHRDGDVQREALFSADQRARNKRDTPLRSILRSEQATQRATASPATSVRLPSSEKFSSDPVMSSPVAQDRALTLLRRMCALLADTLHTSVFICSPPQPTNLIQRVLLKHRSSRILQGKAPQSDSREGADELQEFQF